MILKSFNYRCDGSRTDLAFKRAFRNNFHASSTEVLKNWLLFRQVTVSLHYPHAGELQNDVKTGVWKCPIGSNCHWIHIPCSYSSICGHLKHFIKKLKSSSKIMETKADANRNLQTSVPLNSWCYWFRCFCPFVSIDRHHLIKEVSGVMGDACGLCVWGGKANALCFGRRRTKGV